MSKRKFPEIYVFKITTFRSDKQRINETSKRKNLEMILPEIYKIIEKYLISFMYWNDQHCVIFKSFKFREKVFRHIIVSEKCFQTFCRFEKKFREFFVWRKWLRNLSFWEIRVKRFSFCWENVFLCYLRFDDRRFAKSSFRNILFRNISLCTKVLLDYLISVISRFFILSLREDICGCMRASQK